VKQGYNVIVAFIVIAVIAVALERFEAPELSFRSKVARMFLWSVLILVLLSRWPVLSKMIGGA